MEILYTELMKARERGGGDVTITAPMVNLILQEIHPTPKIFFSIFGIPTPKGRPRFFRRGKFVSTYTPDATRIAEQDFKNQAMKYKPEKPFECALKIVLKFYKPRPKSKPKKEIYWTTKPDLDNFIKVLDALNGIFWIDDSQIIEIHATKAYDDNARTDIEIYEVL